MDADTSSGSVEVRGANGDAKARATAGRVMVQGNPSGNSYWELKTVSGSVISAFLPMQTFIFQRAPCPAKLARKFLS